MEWSEGGKWDNCNSIINKIFFKIMRFKWVDLHNIVLQSNPNVGYRCVIYPPPIFGHQLGVLQFNSVLTQTKGPVL